MQASASFAAAVDSKARAWSEMGVEIKAAFDRIDADSSGAVDAEELLSSLQQLDASADIQQAQGQLR